MKENPLSQSSTLRDAVLAIEVSPRRMTIVVGLDDHLLGTITDGDIRRHLLAGGNLDDLATKAMNDKPLTVKVGSTTSSIQDLMRAKNVLVIPVVDLNHKYTDLLHLMDLISEPTTPKIFSETFSIAVIMAGGEGNRLRPLTSEIPKPMIKLGEIPLLEYQIRSFAEMGIEKIYISVNYLGDIIEKYFGNGANFGIKIDYLREADKTGTAGSLSLLPEIPEKSLLVINGDIFTASDYNALYSFHKSSNSQLTIGAIEHKIEIPYGVIELEGENVSSVKEKPSQHYLCSGGIYALSPQLLSLVPKSIEFNMTDLIRDCLNIGVKVNAFPIHEYWTDIGTPEDLERARKKFAQNEILS
jgi:dTDP-glucose pyrophosphorylase